MTPSIRTTAGQSNINTKGLRLIPIPLPPVERQQDFHWKVESILQLKRSAQRTKSRLESMFHTLLHNAFSGELTAKWREAHTEELLAEMEHQAKVLDNMEN